jgi:hypothetical protein
VSKRLGKALATTIESYTACSTKELPPSLHNRQNYEFLHVFFTAWNKTLHYLYQSVCRLLWYCAISTTDFSTNIFIFLDTLLSGTNYCNACTNPSKASTLWFSEGYLIIWLLFFGKKRTVG